MNTRIRLIEELSLNAHPAIQTELFDGWILRFANGYTGRSNSVNMLYPSEIDLETKIDFCEQKYKAQNLPAIFKIIDAESEDNHKKIDDLLKARGYEIVTPTDLMTLDLGDNTTPKNGRVKGLNEVSLDRPYLSKTDFCKCEDFVCFDFANSEWTDAYFNFANVTSEKTQQIAKQIMNLIQNKKMYCSIIKDNKIVACASVIIENGFAYLSQVVVQKEERGNGYGKLLCQSLLTQAKQNGAHTMYLQVLQNNDVAINLYKKLGFQKEYSYWYRRQK